MADVRARMLGELAAQFGDDLVEGRRLLRLGDVREENEAGKAGARHASRADKRGAGAGIQRGVGRRKECLWLVEQVVCDVPRATRDGDENSQA